MFSRIKEGALKAREEVRRLEEDVHSFEAAAQKGVRSFEDAVEKLDAQGIKQKLDSKIEEAADPERIRQKLEGKIGEAVDRVDTSGARARIEQKVGEVEAALDNSLEAVERQLDARFTEIADSLSSDIQTGFVTEGGSPGLLTTVEGSS